MQETLFQEQPGYRTVAPKPTVKVFIACEDKASFLRGRRVERQVEALCANDLNILPVYWAFALLRHEGLRECAVTEAANAEMIVISFRGTSELPPCVKCWVESLPSRSPVGHAALVVLVKYPEAWARQNPDIAYLRQAAESRGMDFFCNRDEAEPVVRPMRAFSVLGARAMRPANLVSNVIPWIPGGIND